jgi:hypothetical protein
MKVLTVPSSGSVAGQTASRGRYGQYIRTRAIPVQPRTENQLAVRSAFQILSQAWSGLYKDQQSAWTAWAVAHPRKDSLGQSNPLSGAQAYVSVNTVLQTAGFERVNLPPAEPDMTGFDPGTVTATVSTLGIPQFALTGCSLGAADSIFIFSSPPQSPGRSFIAKGALVGAYKTADPEDLTTAFITAIGAIQVGQMLQVTIQPACGGVKGVGVSQLVTVTAPSSSASSAAPKAASKRTKSQSE